MFWGFFIFILLNQELYFKSSSSSSDDEKIESEDDQDTQTQLTQQDEGTTHFTLEHLKDKIATIEKDVHDGGKAVRGLFNDRLALEGDIKNVQQKRRKFDQEKSTFCSNKRSEVCFDCLIESNQAN